MVGGKESHVPQKLLTRDEVAEWLQISTVQLWRLTNVQGVIPTFGSAPRESGFVRQTSRRTWPRE
jgi:hypothetical protein